MSLSLSDLFQTNGLVSNIEDNKNESSLFKDGLSSDYGKQIASSASINTNPTIHSDSPNVTGSNETGSLIGLSASEYDRYIRENQAWKMLSNAIGHTPHVTRTPESLLSILGGIINIGKDSSTDFVVPMYRNEHGKGSSIISTALDTLKNSVSSAIGGDLEPNYDLIFTALTSSNLVNDVLLGNTSINRITGVGNVVGDYLKTEFEKGRWPEQIRNTLNNLNPFDIYTTVDNAVALAGRKGASFGEVIGNVLSNVVTLATGMNNSDGGDEYRAFNRMNNLSPLNASSDSKANYTQKRTASDYATVDSVYATGVPAIGASTIMEAIGQLRAEGLLTSYKDIAGFEMGSNDNWYIRIYPYPHDEDDVVKYLSGGRRPVTPMLPIYRLPNLWGDVAKVESSLPETVTSNSGLASFLSNTVNGLLNKGLEKGREYNYYPSESSGKYGLHLEGAMGDKYEPELKLQGDNVVSMAQKMNKLLYGQDQSILELANKNVRYFSFASCTPALSYDLNLGTIKTDSLKLFNGSQSEIFAGMNFSPVMNISILDDIYGSMFKYMQQYINCVYDIESHSIAPYYNCAFQIELIIMRSGSRINHQYKFIGVPIEYTPRLEGSSEANETRVDITFSIIGFKPYLDKSPMYYGDPRFDKKEASPINTAGATNSTDINPITELGQDNDLTQLTWQDIQIRLS